MDANSAGTSLTIPAVITGLAALISPALALGRWLQEKTSKHRYREEIQRSQELLEFIRKLPETSECLQSDQSALSVQLRAELSQCLLTLQNLLAKRAASLAPPVETAWPRRLLLLYAPRSWGALFLHGIYHLLTVVWILFTTALAFNDATGELTWSEFLRRFQIPVLWVGALFWLLQTGLLWYAASTKDRWDGTLPVRRKSHQRHFLLQTPVTARDLLGRMLLMSSIFDLITPQLFGNAVERTIRSVPAIASVLDSVPSSPVWVRVVGWTTSLLCPVVGYLWSEGEFHLRNKTRFPFPHNLRFIYPAKRWKEWLSQVSILFFLIYSVHFLFDLYQSHELVQRIIGLLGPANEAGDAVISAYFGPTLALLTNGFVPIYASYRIALLSYEKRYLPPAISETPDRWMGLAKRQL